MYPDSQWAELVSRISKGLFHMKLGSGHTHLAPHQGRTIYEILEHLCTFLAATHRLFSVSILQACFPYTSWQRGEVALFFLSNSLRW